MSEKTSLENGSLVAKEIKLSLHVKNINEYLTDMYKQPGTPVEPIVIDQFVKTDLSGIFEIQSGETFTVEFDKKAKTKLKAELLFLQIQNMTKRKADIFDEIAWAKYFNKANDHVVAPNGCYYVKSDNDGKVTASTMKLASTDKPLLFSYYAVFSIKVDNKKYYCIIDPFGKITSGTS
ncbi:hypothetical protein [Flammeovirga agarivorans]|uniref:Uncharacterized protein n=1 Tax=Flammeovirga agarivorans TaxID=2726742 RepID=A0A7X8SKU9_9BACT|nr:hypothetical protein [Flammeovirga agarivorans]NLR92098.1 hypothetical protein [Flammeovirga agarivorans]